ncbi:MAG: hypothetical protein ACFFBC_00095 [Promethearchaeota archaeon]
MRIKNKNIMIFFFLCSIILSTLFFLNTFATVNLNEPNDPKVATTSTGVIRPDGNIQNQWGTSDYSRIDDEVNKPNPGDGVSNAHSGNNEIVVDIFSMGEFEDYDCYDVFSIKIHLRCMAIVLHGGYARIQVTYRFGDEGMWKSPLRTVTSPFGWDWITFTWGASGADELDIDELQVKLIADISASGEGGGVSVDVMYAEFEYEPTIRIISPEDGASFSEPMEGYYPASFGFENDIVGQNPSGWGINEYINVEAEIDGHKKVVKAMPEAAFDYAIMGNTFTGQTSGKIEMWYRCEVVEDFDLFYLYDTYQNVAIKIERTNIGNWRYHGRDGWVVFSSGEVSADTWYHLRIDFDCELDRFDFYIDGDLKVDHGLFFDWRNSIGEIRLASFSFDAFAYGCYFDAIGYSWDPKYNIGDNLKEGLFFDIEPTDADDMWYSLDDGDPVSITGDFVIPFPFTRHHTIKVGGTIDGTEVETPTTAFSFDFGEKIAILFWLDEVNGTHIEDYIEILENEGFTKFYCDMNLELGEFYSIFDQVDAYEDENDIIFLYLHGHGARSGDDTIIQLHPEITWKYRATEFMIEMAQLESKRKMVLAHCCHAGGFVNYFDFEPYTVISSCKINELSRHYPSGEGYFNRPFFDAIENGANAYQAFSIASAEVASSGMTPQISDLCDITFFAY